MMHLSFWPMRRMPVMYCAIPAYTSDEVIRRYAESQGLTEVWV
jgi:hypothetical protein